MTTDQAGEAETVIPTIKPTATPGVKEELIFEASDPFLGKADAKITLTVFSDFQCPFCAALSGENPEMVSKMQSRDTSWTPLFPALQTDYIDKGIVRYVFKHFAFLDDSDSGESHLAGMAAHCAGDQQKFWEFHNTLYQNQSGENKGTFSKEKLKLMAKDLGLKEGEFADCLDRGKYLKKVVDDTKMGRGLGVDGTPALFINGKLDNNGADSYLNVRKLIEEVLVRQR